MQPLSATVNVIEPLGKETYLELGGRTHSLFVLFHREIQVKPRQSLELGMDMGKIHLFEKRGNESAVF